MMEETLKKLILELTETSYEEDKIEILSIIYKSALEDPLTVGSFCIKPVFNMIFEMEDQHFQYKILEILFNTAFKEEFFDILAEDENFEKIFDMSLAETLHLCSLFKGRKFTEFTTKSGKAIRFLKNALKTTKSMEIADLIEINAEELVRNGAFKEEHLEINTMKLLLKNSVKNQNIFIKEKMFVKYKNEIEIAEIVLNPLLYDLKEAQNCFLVPKLMHEAIEMKNYKFIWKLVRGNGNAFKFAIKFLSAEELSEAADELNCNAADILDLWMGIDEKCVEATANGLVVSVLLNIRGIQNLLDSSFIFSAIKSRPEVTLCYLIFVSAPPELNLQPFLDSSNPNKLIFYLSLFLSLIQKYPVNFSLNQILVHLCDFRAFLSKNQTFSTKIDEMLLNSLSEFLKYYNEHVYEETVEEFKREKGVPMKETGENTIEQEKSHPGQNEEDKIDSMINIDNLERLNRGIQSVLRFFRRKEDEDN
ncbi:hypothetical protein NUSPORA_01893 [Nucleospora cyclopteri]